MDGLNSVNNLPGMKATNIPPPATSDSSRKQSDALEVYSLQLNFRLKFSVDEATGKMVVKIINNETQQVIKIIPPEEALKVAARIQQMVEPIIDNLI